MALGGCEQCPGGLPGPLKCTQRASRAPEDFTEGRQGRDPAFPHFRMLREGARPNGKGPISNEQAEGEHHTSDSQETGQLGHRMAMEPPMGSPGMSGSFGGRGVSFLE